MIQFKYKGITYSLSHKKGVYDERRAVVKMNILKRGLKAETADVIIKQYTDYNDIKMS